MQRTLHWDSCATDIYVLLWKRKKMTLPELYDYLEPLWVRSSIRRSLYVLRDMEAIYKKKPNAWHFDKKQKPIPLIRDGDHMMNV